MLSLREYSFWVTRNMGRNVGIVNSEFDEKYSLNRLL